MSRRHEIALTAEEQSEMLRTAHTIHISSLDRRGYPHTVPMWFFARDGRVFMTTYGKSQKAMNLRRDPRCSLLVEDGREYDKLRGILIRGRAVIHADVEAVLDTLVRIHSKHGMPGSAEQISAVMRAQAAKRVLIEVVPEHVSSWDHRKLAGRY